MHMVEYRSLLPVCKPSIGHTPTRELSPPTPWQQRRDMAEQHNGRVANRDGVIQVFTVEIEGRPVVFLNSEDATAAADAHNASRADGQEMAIARRACASVYFPAESNPRPRTEVLKAHVPVELADRFKRRCSALGVDLSKLISAMVLSQVTKMDDQHFGAAPIKAIESYEAGRRRPIAWLEAKLRMAEACSTASGPEATAADRTDVEQRVRDIVESHAISNFAPCFSHFRE